MREVSEDDWKEFHYKQASTPILFDVIDEQSPNLHFSCITALYKRYRLGDWNNEISPAKSLEDKAYLAWADQISYCLFHKQHEKFGENIIECGCLYVKNAFAFFDYHILKIVFNELDKGGAYQTPHVPIYYAQVVDRHEYKMKIHDW